MHENSRRRPLWRNRTWMLLALPLAACVVPTFDLQPEDGSDENSDSGIGGNDGGAGADGANDSSSDSGGDPSGSGSAPGGGGSSAGGESGDGSDSGGSDGGGSDSGGSDSGGSDSGGSDSGGSDSGGSDSGGSGGTGEDLDQNGKPITAGGTLSTPGDYFRMGDFRLVNDRTGSDDLGCPGGASLYVNSSADFSWDFARSDCDTVGTFEHPDFPRLEIGIHPFGDALDTELDFSSTLLLPLQLQDIVTATFAVDSSATLQNPSSWTTELRFWLSELDPTTAADPGVYAQVSVLWGWNTNRWPSAPGADGAGDVGSPAHTVASGGNGYTLWVRNDDWKASHRYLEFRRDAGSSLTFDGTLDLAAFVDYLIATRGYADDLWLTQIQVGSEIDDNTSGSVALGGASLELNGQTRTALVLPP